MNRAEQEQERWISREIARQKYIAEWVRTLRETKLPFGDTPADVQIMHLTGEVPRRLRFFKADAF